MSNRCSRKQLVDCTPPAPYFGKKYFCFPLAGSAWLSLPPNDILISNTVPAAVFDRRKSHRPAGKTKNAVLSHSFNSHCLYYITVNRLT